jgi:hypothetical protein
MFEQESVWVQADPAVITRVVCVFSKIKTGPKIYINKVV